MIRSRFHGQLDRIEQDSGVAPGNIYQVIQGISVEPHVEAAVAPLFIRKGSLGDGIQILRTQRFELKDAGAADQGRIDLEEWIQGGGTDKNKGGSRASC
jgi:hypothetical protein